MRIYKPRYFRQLPDIVRAVQWQPGQRAAGIVLERPARVGQTGLLPVPAHAVLHTLFGSVAVFAGDWIITEPAEYRHVVSQAHFEQRYLAVEGQHGLFFVQQSHSELARIKVRQR